MTKGLSAVILSFGLSPGWGSEHVDFGWWCCSAAGCTVLIPSVPLVEVSLCHLAHQVQEILLTVQTGTELAGENCPFPVYWWDLGWKDRILLSSRPSRPPSVHHFLSSRVFQSLKSVLVPRLDCSQQSTLRKMSQCLRDKKKKNRQMHVVVKLNRQPWLVYSCCILANSNAGRVENQKIQTNTKKDLCLVA